jgi:hypothetical protein
MKDGEARGQIFRACCSLAGSFGVTDNVDEKDMGDLKLNLLCGVGGHDHFGPNEATIFEVSKEPQPARRGED